MRFRKKDKIAHAVNILFCFITWIFLNFRIFVSGRIETIEEFKKSKLFATDLGYLNLFQIVGMTMTILFVLTCARVLALDDTYFLIRLKRDGYVKHKAKKTAVTAFLFTVEYTAVHIFYSLIFCKLSVLGEVKFFQCMGLFFIGVFEYFLIVGACMQFLQYLFRFSGLYMAIAVMVFIFLTTAHARLGIEISPAFFGDTAQSLAYYGEFDWYTLIVNAIETAVVCPMFIILGRLIFLKRDIIIYEKVEFQE